MAEPDPNELAPPSILARIKGIVGQIKTKLALRKKDPDQVAIPWTAQIGLTVKGVQASVLQLLESLWSKDQRTRRMAYFMIFCFLGLTSVSIFTARRWSESRHSRRRGFGNEQGKNLDQFFSRQNSLTQNRLSTVTLNGFIVELKGADQIKKTPGYMHLAEIDVVITCESGEVGNYLNEHVAAVRDQITNTLTAIDRDQLMSAEGKKTLRRAILDRLNRWLPQGKISDVYINRLIVS